MGAQSAAENFWAATPTFGTNWIPRMLEATLDLVKRLEISKELIRECVTVPGCCCCMPLLHNHLMDSCNYVHKNTLLAAWTPLTPPKSATGYRPRALARALLQYGAVQYAVPACITSFQPVPGTRYPRPQAAANLIPRQIYRLYRMSCYIAACELFVQVMVESA